jgi:hypothetical protein
MWLDVIFRDLRGGAGRRLCKNTYFKELEGFWTKIWMKRLQNFCGKHQE